jgi:hypothetical protein
LITGYVTEETALLETEKTRRSIRWSRDNNDAMFGIYVGLRGTYRLVVEQAGTTWRWLVWATSDPSRGQSGQSRTAIHATRAAKAAVCRIDQDIA